MIIFYVRCTTAELRYVHITCTEPYLYSQRRKMDWQEYVILCITVYEQMLKMQKYTVHCTVYVSYRYLGVV